METRSVGLIITAHSEFNQCIWALIITLSMNIVRFVTGCRWLHFMVRSSSTYVECFTFRFQLMKVISILIWLECEYVNGSFLIPLRELINRSSFLLHLLRSLPAEELSLCNGTSAARWLRRGARLSVKCQ